MTIRRAVLGAAAILPAFGLFPAGAQAHGLVGRADLPVPEWLFSWGAVVVLVASFVGLAVLWRQPRLQDRHFAPLPDRWRRALTSRVVEVVCGATGLGLLALILWAGFAGADSPVDNIVPTLVYVVLWLGLVPVSLVFGDVFRAFNPWRAGGRLVGWALGSRLPRPIDYPTALVRRRRPPGLRLVRVGLGSRGGSRHDRHRGGALFHVHVGGDGHLRHRTMVRSWRGLLGLLRAPLPAGDLRAPRATGRHPAVPLGARRLLGRAGHTLALWLLSEFNKG